jgi:YHS domain-containing protein
MLKTALLAIVAALAMPVGQARSEQASVFNQTLGIAIGGYDVMTYYSGEAPRRGSAEHAVQWKGVIWQFTSARNRETFEANPRAFAPQYGGYCAYAVSHGYLASGDPGAWEIRDGRLYLMHSPSIREMWQRDRAGHIKRAEANWPAVLRE